MRPVTAFAFGGLNGLTRPKTYSGLLTLDPVQRRLSQAESVLLELTGQRVALAEWLLDDTTRLYDFKTLHLAALAVIAIQVGTAESMAQALGEPDWSSGISLGDTARTVFAGCGSLEDALVCTAGMVRRLPDLAGLGESVIAILPRARPLDQESANQLRRHAISCSPLSGRILNLSGSAQAISHLRELAARRGWRLKTLANYPTHSPALESHAHELRRGIHAGVLAPPRHKLLSSRSQLPLTTIEQVRDDLALLVTSCYDWSATVSCLAREHGVTRLVNIGPCITLRLATHQLGLDIEVIDASEALEIPAL